MTQEDKDTASRNKIYFKVLSILLVLVFFVLVEIVLRMFSYGRDVDLFVDYKEETRDPYLMVNPHAGEKYFNRFEATSGTNDLFLKTKSENGFRIFLLGSSTLYGYPYGKNLMASRILQARLQDAYPAIRVEVINTSITAINSTTLKDYLPQVLKQDPDAILIYAGHNEFYGAFGVGSNETMSRNPFLLGMHFKLIKLRTYQLIQAAIEGISAKLRRNAESPEESGTLMKRIVGDENILFHGEKYQVGMEQYRKNLSFILKKARQKEVPVLISDLVSNIKDLPPFGDTGNADQSAGKTYQEAIKVLATGDTAAARSLFYRAKDLDPIRFRASEEINELIYELSEHYDATLIPVKEQFSNASPGGLIGDKLLTEHVHPNIEGQFLLADAFYKSILSSGVTGQAPLSKQSRSKEYYRRHWAFTTLDSLMGAYKIAYLKSHWPFVPLQSETTFRDTFSTRGLLDSLAFSIVTDPRSTEASLHTYLAEYYEKNQDLPLALMEYKALIRINPYRSESFHRAANCLLKMNDLYAAEIYLNQSNLYRKSSFAHALLGDILAIKHDFRAALQHYKSALDLEGKEDSGKKDQALLVNDLKMKISRISKLNSQAIASLDFDYPKYIPENIREPYMHALSHSRSDTDSALYYYFRCLEINDCPLVNFQIGDLLYQMQDKGILPYYEKAYDGFAKHPDFLVRYCVACIYMQESFKAKELYRELVELAPNHSALPNIKEAIGV